MTTRDVRVLVGWDLWLLLPFRASFGPDVLLRTTLEIMTAIVSSM